MVNLEHLKFYGLQVTHCFSYKNRCIGEEWVGEAVLAGLQI
jgi:hypothetical protein